MTEFKKILAEISGPNFNAIKQAQQKLDCLTKPKGSLGRLEEIALALAGITGMVAPSLARKVVFVFAADHGIAVEGVSAFPQAVTAQMVENFIQGGAAINVLARLAGARVVIADLGVASDLKPQSKLIIKKIGYGTKNILVEPAMTKTQAKQALTAGISIFEQEYTFGLDLVMIGEMGIANTTASSAIAAAITKADLRQLVGRGTGIDDCALGHKIDLIKQALAKHQPNSSDALDLLAKVGGFEIAGLVGVIIASAAKKVPIIIDGFISGAAALIAYTLEPKTKNYMFAGHCSQEIGHKIILEHIGIKPLLDLNLRLGEGTGAVLASNIVEASAKILNEMATFKSAGVSEKTEKK